MKANIKKYSNIRFLNYIAKRPELIRSLYNQVRILKFKSETFYQACYFMDLILLNNKLKLEIAAVACLIIAAKFIENDSHIPDLRKFESFGNKYRFSVDELSEMEVNIIKILKYELSCPSAYQFLNFFLSNGIIVYEELLNNNKSTALKESPLLANSTSTNLSSANEVLANKIYTLTKKILFSLLESKAQMN